MKYSNQILITCCMGFLQMVVGVILLGVGIIKMFDEEDSSTVVGIVCLSAAAFLVVTSFATFILLKISIMKRCPSESPEAAAECKVAPMALNGDALQTEDPAFVIVAPPLPFYTERPPPSYEEAISVGNVASLRSSDEPVYVLTHLT